jgi:sugar lactone lactonase YvrE
MQAELVVDARNAVGESPVWLAAEQALYWADIPARRLLRWQASTGSVSRWESEEMLGCIAPHASGGWLGAAESGIFHLAARDGSARLAGERIASVNHAMSGMRCNTAAATARAAFAPAPC